jgi:hypothetical protein
MAQVDRTRRTPPERALIYAAVMSEASLQEINGILDASGFRALPKTSYDLIRRSYVPVFRLYPPSLLENIQSPYTMAKIASMWRKDASNQWEFISPLGDEEPDL